jgi:putative transposase
MFKSHTIEIKPNSHQKRFLNDCLGLSRKFYNEALGFYICSKKESDDYIGRNELVTFLTDNKGEHDHKVPMFIKNSASDRLAKALDRCLVKKISKFPRFKVKNKSMDSFTYTVSKSTKKTQESLFSLDGMKFTFPFPRYGEIESKYKYFKLTEKLRFEGKVKTITIFRKYNRYFANFVVELSQDIPKTIPLYDQLLSFDLGLKTFVHTNFNDQFKFPKGKYYYFTKKIEFHQSKMSTKYDKTKKIQSNNYYKEYNKFLRFLRKRFNLTDDYLKQLVKLLTVNFKYISMENLNKMFMLKNRHFSRRVSQTFPIGKFKQLLKSQLNENLILVDKFFPSTQTCSCCGHRFTKQNKLGLGVRTYNCPNCGLSLDRDLNAAINIYNYGIKVLKKRSVELQPIGINDNPINIITHNDIIQNLTNFKNNSGVV